MAYPPSIEWNPVKDKSKSNKIKRNSKIHQVGPMAEKVICRECGLDWSLHKYRNPYECIRLLRAKAGITKTPFDCSGLIGAYGQGHISISGCSITSSGTNTVTTPGWVKTTSAPSYAGYTSKMG